MMKENKPVYGMDLLHKKNHCGQTLTSRGNAIIAELMRLADVIPDVFHMQSAEDQAKYQHIVLDFSYFNSIELFEHRIDSSPDLQDLDEDFKDTHYVLLSRFYKAFDSVLGYVTDFSKFLSDLDDGVFIYQTLENVLSDNDGKQLLTEALYLYGVMLLTVDQRIPGIVRERLIVSFHRYCANESEQANIEAVINLFRSTGYIVGGKQRPEKYPEAYFARIDIPRAFVRMVISRVRSDDIYNQMQAFPQPDHRSTALATQAAMLYIILYFDPQTLLREQAKMREIVDKHFPDNWVISVYMGMTVNLCHAWEPYKAARLALNNTLEQENVEHHAKKYFARVSISNQELEKHLKEGVLHQDFVLDSIQKLLRLMQEANVTLRWLMLHTYEDPSLSGHKRVQQIRDLVINLGFKPELVFQIILNISQFEFLLKEMFEVLQALKDEAASRMMELSDVFGGNVPLSRIEKNEDLQGYFANTSNRIASFDYSNSTSAGRKISQLIRALDEVQDFHQLQNSLQVKQFLQETQIGLRQMLRTINIKEETLQKIGIIADLSYAWQIIDTYTGLMQQKIKSDPALVIKLRATFLKLASALEIPLVRILQASSGDLASVSQFYSSELVHYVRKVLQIIPRSMFRLLEEIIQLQTKKMKDLPTRLEKDQLKDHAQLELRERISELTYKISIFTEGILMMKSTLVGVVEVDPKQLLEDGIRKELVHQVAHALDATLVFEAPKGKEPNLFQNLIVISRRLQGIRRSFEYIQDYVSIYGLKIWQEEVSRIINFNVEQECNTFLRTQTLESDSSYQSKAIPIPKFPPRDRQSRNFVGRLAREILRRTHPETTLFIEKARSWYDQKTKAKVMGPDVFKQMQESLDTFGLNGIDKLFSFMLAAELQQFVKRYPRFPPAAKKLLNDVFTDMQPLSSNIQPKVGHIQLIRRMIATQLNYAAKFDGKLLLSALSALNSALLNEVEGHYRDPSKPYPGGDSLVLHELSEYLEAVGESDPLAKIYVTTKKLDKLAVYAFFTTITQLTFERFQLQRVAYSRSTGSLIAKKQGDSIDGPAFVCGMVTLLKQCHVNHTHTFFDMAAQFIRSHVVTAETKTIDLGPQAINMLAFLEEFAKYGNIPRKVLDAHIPSYLLDQFKRHAS
eukprot:gene1097-4325_t